MHNFVSNDKSHNFMVFWWLLPMNIKQYKILERKPTRAKPLLNLPILQGLFWFEPLKNRSIQCRRKKNTNNKKLEGKKKPEPSYVGRRSAKWIQHCNFNRTPKPHPNQLKTAPETKIKFAPHPHPAPTIFLQPHPHPQPKFTLPKVGPVFSPFSLFSLNIGLRVFGRK